MNTGSKSKGTHLPNGINPSMCMYQVSGTGMRGPLPGALCGGIPWVCPILFLLLCELFCPGASCNVSDPIGVGCKLG